MASAPTIDYAAAAMRATRVCCSCGRGYAGEAVQRDPARTPLRTGWRCGACTRAREPKVRARARELIVESEPRWELALRTARHSAFDDCLECEAILAARELLLARGALTRAERGELAAALLSHR